jgi:TRAP-type C4-dicarboxylate transport system permease small subunit
VILAQVVGRFIGVVIPSVPQIAGFLMAAAIFLALSYTFANDEHIRVSLVIEQVGERARWWLELWSLSVSAALVGFFAFFAGQLAYESWLFNDRSDGLLPIPYFIPQSAMTLGISVLFIRLVDELTQLLRGTKPRRLRSTTYDADRE